MTGRFGTVVTAMATPFGPDGSLDLDGVGRLVDHLLTTGTDAIVVSGSTGEAPTLTDDERRELLRAAIAAAAGRGKIIAGTGTYSTAETIERTREAATAGADGALVVTPYYNKPPQRGLVEHFRAVAGATDLPLMIYNIPGRTGTRVAHDTLLLLAEHPTIAAVKDSTGDVQGASRLVVEARGALDVYCGDDWAAFAFACVGAVGLVSVAAHLVGSSLHRMLDLVAAGDLAAARTIHEDLTPLFDALFVTSNPIPLKAALAVLGLPGGHPRLPLVPADAAERARVEEALEGVGLR